MASLIVIAVVAFGYPLLPWRRVAGALARVWARVVGRRSPPPAGRPIEAIAADARRLSITFRAHPRGISFVKYEAHRRAYDDVLAEGCRALGVAHLIGVLEPGPELDAERARVEWALECAGLELALPW